jgi:hypothetical protein
VTPWMRGLSVVMRTTADPSSLVSVARDVVRSVDPSVPLVEPQRMTALVDRPSLPFHKTRGRVTAPLRVAR